MDDLFTRRRNAATVALICVVVSSLALVSPAAGATTTRFRPRIRGALGLIPVPGGPEIATGSNYPIVYHGGSVMRDVTIHTIFWAPPGYRFAGAPSAASVGYQAMVQRFFTDVAGDSAGATNVFSVLNQYGDRAGPGRPGISYNAATDSINAVGAYPAAHNQCPSPEGVATCVTDLELQREIDRVIQWSDRGARGLGNLWFIFLPPDVDTCTTVGNCASNAYAGYHSSFDLGHGVTIYAVVPDPLVEAPFPAGSDPQGNPDAEIAINAAAHEAAEAITDPQGVGWMDPSGSEVGDKCESGPELGSPLGYAPDGSPYNQSINGEEWLIQMMWSNALTGCVQSSTAAGSAPALAQVHLTQFSASVSGDIGTAHAGVGVAVSLLRAGTVVGRASATTRSTGAWGPVSLHSLTRSKRVAFGDDRDEIVVDYGGGGPAPDVILTGDGGNPFTQSGWTGWFDLDNGFSVASFAGAGGVLLGPCSQTGILTLTVGRAATAPPINQCGTETDVAILTTGPIGPGTSVRFESEDNRASSPVNPAGALVSLRVPLGEPNSVSALGNSQLLFEPSGFPLCTADLQAQRVTCTGLVPGARYALTRRRGHATVHVSSGFSGSITAPRFPGARAITGGDAVTLTNAAHRRLTTLHVAHLRVNIVGAETVISSGTCQAGDYYGPPPSAPPINQGVGAPGIGGTGTICPPDGRAKGLQVSHIEQTDDLSGGVTTTDVPLLEFTSPTNGATLYGQFTALAGAGIPTPRHSVIPSAARVAVTITHSYGGPPVFAAENVNTAGGVGAGALATGTYIAKWVLTDANGDTRTVVTRFVEAG